MKSKSAVRGQISLIAIIVVATLVVVAVVGLAMRGRGDDSSGSQLDSYSVRKGDFDISIPVSGELAALKQIEIRNNLDTRAIITEIVAEGSYVQQGQIVLRLNDDEIRTKLRDAQDKVNVADAALIAAQAKYDIQVQTRDAELAKADLAIKLADLALKAWQEGEVVAKRQELALAIQTAEKEFVRLDVRFKESAGLLEQKFISEDEYKRDEIAMMKASSDLELARLAEKVYESYQFEQDKAQKFSNLDQARSERKRIEQQHDAEVRSAKSDVDSKKFQLDSAREQLAELEQELAYCAIEAPAAGLVVYYSSLQSNGWGRNEGRPPQVGTELTRNEPVMVLPDTSQMVAAVKISEALSGMIKPGQRATVTSDALPDRVLHGAVQNVGVLAESGGWRDPNRREYTVRIVLDEGNDYGLKPSMRCKANVYVGRVESSLHVPVQAVFRGGSVSFVYVPQGSGYAQRRVTLGRSSELFIEVLDGLTEGEVVLLREPETNEIIERIAEARRGDSSEQSPEAEGEQSSTGGQPERGPRNGMTGEGRGDRERSRGNDSTKAEPKESVKSADADSAAQASPTVD